MIETICLECKNYVIRKHLFEGKHKSISMDCIYPLHYKGVPIIKCSHFEEKQDYKNKPKLEAKQTANKGKPPRKQPKKKFDKVFPDTGK